MCWLYIIEKDEIRPDFVVSTEPTDMHVYRGHRGRMEIKVEVRVFHATAQLERGDNAIYKMADILQEVRDLNAHLKDDLSWAKAQLPLLRFTSPHLHAAQ